ncbi:uncharacterized protein LOC110835674 isoform X1 [Zootermopsis nevadensis]|uniref:uncharacterized protein LOC110835674 isoform X1 n=1 Tax=Zootermopsis nevadensis TaxID=136037 RepID=UPI000B8E3C00|nr:uncharacterized protein LOC110835674 isoform X1 [Zootermopsis nevadensis]XP_021931842.1 uncharacterized protein LOC110835674 isoform X2 [Zootermopsis nevadensis]XP_021931843.1 uncharacterized protein LOC110835674 isoform X1 [Zootermopsis nevadensis]XP_021931844.1 uncharacterized protein LOC110835674 isoform X1 [Zootermopsis nevadensis]XP_021931845.1 uncharacterized protein LOC110835674 isoform X1 [Zootermopsis nevadensis]XP_021931846.1 uncharacterized protein LOC110835674 isoform X1 [Zooter
MPTFLLKILQLVVTIICVGLVASEWYVAASPTKTAVVNGTLIGYIMLSTVIILGVILDTPLDRKLILVITLPGAVMFFASGAIMMEAWNIYAVRSDKVLGAGILTFLNGIAYIADFVLTFLKYR